MAERKHQAHALCRSCFTEMTADLPRCPHCNNPRVFSHPELSQLAIAHIDCDAFYAAIEKRDNPDIRNKPVIVGGGNRGVVATCCYLARIKGVRSAMPMFEANRKCPDAVVIRPNMEKYRRVGGQIREFMQELTPLVEPISIDEAFLDLRGTERLHHQTPAAVLMRLASQIEDELGLTISVGLSYNKFLAKLASDMDKPRGFTVIGQAEVKDRLAPLPVGRIWGVGATLQNKLRRNGIQTIGQLQSMEKDALIRTYGSMGPRLYHFSRGEDSRGITPKSPRKSVSSETTFDKDIRDYDALEKILWRLSEKVAETLKEKGLMGATVTLKLKSNHHKTITRSTTPSDPVQMAADIISHGTALLKAAVDGTPIRLLGIGVSGISQAQNDFTGQASLDRDREKRIAAEAAMDRVRDRFGTRAVKTGRTFDGDKGST